MSGNVNCLEGMQCPQCKDLGPFWIKATTYFLVCDEGIEGHRDVEWDDHNYCTCACGHVATVACFREAVSL